MTDAKWAGCRAFPVRAGCCVMLLLCGWATCAGDDPPPANRDLTAQLRGADIEGLPLHVTEGSDRRGSVFVFLATQCPISNGYIPELNRLAERCRGVSVDFFGVISDRSVSRDQARRLRDDFGVRFPLLLDDSGEVRQALGATHTPQAFAIAEDGRLRYSGRIDNLYGELGKRRETASVHDLRDAISALTRREASEPVVTVPVGCLLNSLDEDRTEGSVTYNRDIAAILYANCTECHRPGEAAPFSLCCCADAVRHAAQIAAVTQSRFMPPWHPVENFGHFQNVRLLSDADVALIQRWVADGAPEGEAYDVLIPPQFQNGWRLGQPDLVLKMSDAFEVSADGPDIHQHFVLPTGLPKPRLVSAVEFRPGNPGVTHHASFYVDTFGAARKLAALQPDVGYGSFVGPGFLNAGALRSWLPGMSPQHLPEGTGQLLQAHSDLVIEVHYRHTGKAETDQSMVGLHFARPSARQLVGEFQVLNKELSIPAGAARHLHRATFTLPVDAMLLDTCPHMHLLGREMKAVAVQPDGTIVPLVWINDWDFNWQGQYLYAEPVHLPKGTRVEVDAWYDNSADNPLNPHSPPQTITWGEQTNQEMGICHFRYTTKTFEEFVTLNDHFLSYANEQQRLLEQMPAPAP